MKIKVPDYYKDFSCKCGACRHSCCDGWRITISEEEYYRLIGVECSPELRHRLDCGFHILEDCTHERFAEMNRTYLGDCRMRSEDGLCALQNELGERALPQVCRLYPRNITHCVMGEGACANSCERVIELLTERERSLTLTEIEVPYSEDIPVSEEMKVLQAKCFEDLCDHTLSLDERLLRLGELLEIPMDEEIRITESELFAELLELIEKIEQYSPSFGEYSILAREDLEAIGEGIDRSFVAMRYREAKALFDEHFPDNELWLENIMNNHLFFDRFPYSQGGETPVERFSELCGLFAVLRFICIAYTETRPERADFVDCAAGLFRCFEHTDFESLFRKHLEKIGRCSYSYIRALIKMT